MMTEKRMLTTLETLAQDSAVQMETFAGLGDFLASRLPALSPEDRDYLLELSKSARDTSKMRKDALAGTMQLKGATVWEVIGVDEDIPIRGRRSASPNGGGWI